MTDARETYAEAFTRLKTKYEQDLGPIPKDLMPKVEEEAQHVLELQGLPVLTPRKDRYDNERYYCPTCKRRLSQNYATRDTKGYASLNCHAHGWVGKWKP